MRHAPICDFMVYSIYLINAFFQIMLSVPNLMNVSVYLAGKEIYVTNAPPIQDALKAQYIYILEQ